MPLGASLLTSSLKSLPQVSSLFLKSQVSSSSLSSVPSPALRALESLFLASPKGTRSRHPCGASSANLRFTIYVLLALRPTLIPSYLKTFPLSYLKFQVSHLRSRTLKSPISHFRTIYALLALRPTLIPSYLKTFPLSYPQVSHLPFQVSY